MHIQQTQQSWDHWTAGLCMQHVSNILDFLHVSRQAMLLMHTRFKELFTTVSYLLPVRGSVHLQEFSPLKLRTGHEQLNPNNKEVSAVVQESELVGLPFGC